MSLILSHPFKEKKGIIVFTQKELFRPKSPIIRCIKRLQNKYTIGCHFGWSLSKFKKNQLSLLSYLDFAMLPASQFHFLKHIPELANLTLIPLTSRNFISPLFFKNSGFQREFLIGLLRQYCPEHEQEACSKLDSLIDLYYKTGQKQIDYLWVNKPNKCKRLDLAFKILKNIPNIQDKNIVFLCPLSEQEVKKISDFDDPYSLAKSLDFDLNKLIILRPCAPNQQGISWKSLPLLYKISKDFLFTSYIEGESRVVTEAAVSGANILYSGSELGPALDYVNQNSSPFLEHFRIGSYSHFSTNELENEFCETKTIPKLINLLDQALMTNHNKIVNHSEGLHFLLPAHQASTCFIPKKGDTFDLYHKKQFNKFMLLAKSSSTSYSLCSRESLDILENDGILVFEGFWNKQKCSRLCKRIDLLSHLPSRITKKQLGAGFDTRYPNFEYWSLSVFKFLYDPLLSSLVDNFLSRPPSRRRCQAGKVDSSQFRDVPNHQINSGGGWHIDNHNRQIKAMIYLNHVDDQNGPFQFIRRSASLAKNLETYPAYKGDKSRTRFSDSVISRNFNLSDILTVTGTPGTLIIFNSSNIHRGSPCKGVRYSLTNYYY